MKNLATQTQLLLPIRTARNTGMVAAPLTVPASGRGPNLTSSNKTPPTLQSLNSLISVMGLPRLHPLPLGEAAGAAGLLRKGG